VVTTVAILQ